LQNKYNNKYNISFIGETVTELLSKKEKQRILKTLETDEEFRYAIAGLIGLNTIISELKKLREDFAKHIEMEEKRWEENEKRWQENLKRWEKNEKSGKKLLKYSKSIERGLKSIAEYLKDMEKDLKNTAEYLRNMERGLKNLLR